MVLFNMLMEIALPKMGELLVMMMTMISPSGREVPPAESLHRKAKVLLPKFRLEVAALHPESPLLIFFLGQNDLYTKRWAPDACQGALARPGGLCPPGAPPSGIICTRNSEIFRKNRVKILGHSKNFYFWVIFIAREIQKIDKTWHFILFN